MLIGLDFQDGRIWDTCRRVVVVTPSSTGMAQPESVVSDGVEMVEKDLQRGRFLPDQEERTLQGNHFTLPPPVRGRDQLRALLRRQWLHKVCIYLDQFSSLSISNIPVEKFYRAQEQDLFCFSPLSVVFSSMTQYWCSSPPFCSRIRALSLRSVFVTLKCSHQMTQIRKFT